MSIFRQLFHFEVSNGEAVIFMQIVSEVHVCIDVQW